MATVMMKGNNMSKTKATHGHRIWIALFVFALILVSSVFSQKDEAEDLVSKIAERMAEFPEAENYEAEVSAMLISVDKNWKAKKTTLVEKIVRMRDGVREEEILSALETDKGKKKDVTQKMRDETRKQQEKAKKKRAKQERKGKAGSKRGGGRQELTLDEMFPFNEKKREKYIFQQGENVVFEGKTALVLESKAKLRSDKYYEGTYFIDPDSFEILRALIKPAKNPGPIKKLEMEFFFQVLPEGFFVPKETRVRVHVGLVIKSIRMEIQEVYKSFKRLDL